MYQKIIRHWPVLLIVSLAFISRVVNLEKLFYFTYDESIPAFVGRRLILWQHVPLIGGVTPFGFHLGPYFYWLLAAVLFLGKLNPIAWGVAGALFATATTFMIFVVGKNFANKKAGFIAACFWAFSYLANIYDRHFWALYWGPLISLIVLFSIYKIIKGHFKYVYLLSLTIAFGIHADPSNLVFLALATVSWIIYKLPLNKHLLIAILLITASFLPLVAFDLRHNFANTKPILQFLKNRKSQSVEGKSVAKSAINNVLVFPVATTRLVYTFGDREISKQYSYCQSYIKERKENAPGPLIVAAALILSLLTVYGLKQKNKNPGLFLSSLLILIYFIGIQIYGTLFKADIFEHYITGTFAPIILLIASRVSRLPRKVWLAILAVFVAANLYKLSVTTNSHGLTYKREAIEYTMTKVEEKPFSLDSLSTCWKYNGYRYLFAAYGKEPIKSYVDPNFAYLYGTTPVAERHPPIVVAFVTHDFVPETDDFYKRYAILKSHETSSSLFGNIEVVIMDNSDSWFETINSGITPPPLEQQQQ